MKQLVEWLEKDDRRTRKFLALLTAFVWVLCVIVNYLLYALAGKSDISILSLVTAQFAAVIGFYMATNAETD